MNAQPWNADGGSFATRPAIRMASARFFGSNVCDEYDRLGRPLPDGEQFEIDSAGFRRQKTAEKVEECRFSTTGRAKKGEEFAFVDLKGDLLQRQNQGRRGGRYVWLTQSTRMCGVLSMSDSGPFVHESKI